RNSLYGNFFSFICVTIFGSLSSGSMSIVGVRKKILLQFYYLIWLSFRRLFFPFRGRLMSLLRLRVLGAHLGLCSRKSVKIIPGMTVCFSLFIQLAYSFFYTDDVT